MDEAAGGIVGLSGEADGILENSEHERRRRRDGAGGGGVSRRTGSVTATPATRSLHPGAILRAMRPLQWTKNAVVFAALVFDRKLFEFGPLLHSLLAAVAFCGVSSAVYLLNDLKDVDADRLHPKKRFRPIAAGLVTPTQAAVTAALLFALALAGGLLDGLRFVGVIAAYALLMVAYTAGLKTVVILDVFAISAGFVLRAAGGAVAIDVPISPWLYVCTMLLALFVGFGKRRSELSSLAGAAAGHRANLEAYSLPLLDQLIGIVAASTVMAYSLYTFNATSGTREGGAMMLTIPFVVYAIFRYLFLVHRRDLGGSPEALLFADRPLLGAIAGWGFTSIAILYLIR